MEFTEMRKSKEEREGEKARRQQIRNLWQSAGVTDIKSFNNLIDEMKKVILEDMYEAEMDTHMQYGKSEKRPEESDNYRNGSSHKLVKTKDGKLELIVPRDRNGEFEPRVIKKHQSDITEIEDKIIGLYGCGMSTRDISENIQEIYGFGVSAETISNITNRVLVNVDVLISCTDNLTAISEAIGACYPQSDHQKCVVHQIRNSVKHVNYKELKEVCADLKKIYTAPNAEIGEQNLEEFSEKWDKKYGYISKSWRDNWEQLSTFWTYPDEPKVSVAKFER